MQYTCAYKACKIASKTQGSNSRHMATGHYSFISKPCYADAISYTVVRTRVKHRSRPLHINMYLRREYRVACTTMNALLPGYATKTSELASNGNGFQPYPEPDRILKLLSQSVDMWQAHITNNSRATSACYVVGQCTTNFQRQRRIRARWRRIREYCMPLSALGTVPGQKIPETSRFTHKE